jgi:hypothetical protein
MHGNSPVLVNVAEFVKPPKKVTPNGFRLPSLIRLKRYDNLTCFCGYSLGATSNKPSIGCVKNGKLGVFGIGSFQRSEHPNKMIKRSTKAGHQIADYQWNRVGHVLNDEVNMIPLCFDISLGLKSVRLTILEKL